MPTCLGWTPHAPFAFALCGLVLGCGPGTAGKVLRDDTPTISGALGSGACVKPGEDAAPWVVDLPADQRQGLETGLKSGITVVSYDCKSFKILRGCTVDGSYAYSGTTALEDKLSLEDADTVAANFSTGASLAVQIKAEMDRGTKLLVGYVLIGERATTLAQVTTAKLKGRCTGATHVIASASLGAYAVVASASAEIGGVAEIFAQGAHAGSSSSAFRSTQAGDLEACRKAGINDTEPPEGCGAPVKVTLIGISNDERPVPQLYLTSQIPCPAGTVRSGSICVGASRDLPRNCEVGNEAECIAQCNRGNAQSCAVLGFMYEKGKGTKADAKKAFEAYTRACEKQDSDGCTGVGFLVSKGQGVSPNAAMAANIFRKACEKGNARACSGVGHQARLRGEAQEAVRWLERSCKLGYARACFYAGMQLGQDKNEYPHAFDNFTRACDGNDERGCLAVSAMLQSGMGTTPDAAKAASYLTAAMKTLGANCDNKDSEACAVLGYYYSGRFGKTVRDSGKAIAYFEKGCGGGQWDSCYEAGVTYKTGDDVVRPDRTLSKRYIDMACLHEVAAACAEAGRP